LCLATTDEINTNREVAKVTSPIGRGRIASLDAIRVRG
jgi:hypothetical protein